MDRQVYLRPSAAAVWSKCAGYAALNASLGTTPSDEADNEVREDGTACHWLAAELWTGHQHSAGGLSPNNRELTDEMFRGVDEYHDVLRSWNVLHTHIEQTIHVSQFFPGIADGTPDAWACDGDTLFVADFKYGFRPVEVWRNAQLIVYAYTLLCILNRSGHLPQRVQLTICQPRCPHRDGTTRTWVTDVQELGELAAWYAARAQDCYAPNPPCTVNPGCLNCPAAHACRTLQAAALGAAEVSYDATPFELNEQQLGYELSKLMQAQRHLEHRISGLSAQAESLLRRGQRIPGFEMGRMATRWRWRPGTEQLVVRLGEMFNVDVMMPAKVKSVAKLRNAFPIDVQAMYGDKPVGELKLVMSDPNEAAKRFSK
jgi:hypothetical protein